MRSKALAASVLTCAMAASGSSSAGQTPKSGMAVTNSGPPRFTLSSETTYIIEPLLPDGTPDYGAFLNTRFGEDVTSENNAAVLLQSMFGLIGDSSSIDRLMQQMDARKEELGRLVRFTKEPTAEGADVVFELFAKARVEPKMLVGTSVCDSFLWSLPFSSETAAVCRDWQKARPVLEQIVDHEATLRDLERREALITELDQPPR